MVIVRSTESGSPAYPCLLRLRTEPVDAYRVIEAEKANFTIVRMCRLLEVSRSGFYKWRHAQAAGPTPAQQRREALDVAVAGFHAASDGVNGAPRILADLREDDWTISRKTVAASLRRQGLAGISLRTFAPPTTVGRSGRRGDSGSGQTVFRSRNAQHGVDLGHHLSAHR